VRSVNVGARALSPAKWASRKASAAWAEMLRRQASPTRMIQGLSPFPFPDGVLHPTKLTYPRSILEPKDLCTAGDQLLGHPVVTSVEVGKAIEDRLSGSAQSGDQ
jgi:hypothetical protein